METRWRPSVPLPPVTRTMLMLPVLSGTPAEAVIRTAPPGSGSICAYGCEADACSGRCSSSPGRECRLGSARADPRTARGGRAVDMKLEIVVVPVSDVDRARDFYKALGWRQDAGFAAGPDFRVVQL